MLCRVCLFGIRNMIHGSLAWMCCTSYNLATTCSAMQWFLVSSVCQWWQLDEYCTLRAALRLELDFFVFALGNHVSFVLFAVVSYYQPGNGVVAS